MTIITKPKVFSLEPLHSEALHLAREHFDLYLPGDAGFENWRHEAVGLLARNAFVTADDTRQLAEHNLRFIAKQGVGVDNFDLAALRKHGIPLMNTPGVNAVAVAELALGLILDAARGISTIDRRIRRGDAVTKLDGWKGKTLRGTTLGVIGGGHIGRLLATMYHAAFGGAVILYDPYLSDLSSWHAAVSSGRLQKVDDLSDMYTHADVISIHVPLTESTRNLISTQELAAMKDSAILVNTARGGIIDEQALTVALSKGRIFSAALDAVVEEPPSLEKHRELCELDNVVLTPHIGAATERAQQETCLAMVQHLVEAFQGAPLRDRVV